MITSEPQNHKDDEMILMMFTLDSDQLLITTTKTPHRLYIF